MLFESLLQCLSTKCTQAKYLMLESDAVLYNPYFFLQTIHTLIQELNSYYVLDLRLNTEGQLPHQMTHYKSVGQNEQSACDLKGLTSVYSHMVLIVGGTGE